jgi:hypothetical protein
MNPRHYGLLGKPILLYGRFIAKRRGYMFQCPLDDRRRGVDAVKEQSQ